MLLRILVPASAALFALPAAAAETGYCSPLSVCASNPQSVVNALKKDGYKAELTTDGVGDPMINSNASGYKFSVLFYGCENHQKCTSLQFYASFNADENVTAEYANKWNLEHRFGTASADEQNQFFLRYDVTTSGGINTANFSDVIDWWATSLGSYTTFASENS